MNRIGKAAVAALMLSAATAGKASATAWAGNGSYCGGDSFSTCFSVSMSWTFVDATHIAVALTLTNLDTTNCTPANCSAGPLKWFSVGLDRLAADVGGNYTGGVAGYTDQSPNDFSGGPFVANLMWAGNSGGDPPGITPRTWNFTLTGNSRTSLQWDAMMNAAGVGYHAGGVTCSSTKVEVHNGGTGYAANQGPASDCDANPPSPPTEITPEPMSLTLMATGLVGLAGAGFIKRRRKV